MSQDLIEKTKELERKYSKQKKPNHPEKGPRHYAEEIEKLPPSEWNEALKSVPAHLVAWTLEYINHPHKEQREVNRLAATIAKLKTREFRIVALAKVPGQYREQVKAAVIKMMGK